MYRLYYEGPVSPVWTIDEGDPTTSQHFEQVIIKVLGVTRYDLTQDNEYHPLAWIEFSDADLKIVNNTAILK